jgi:KUP system potassium uptake protein
VVQLSEHFWQVVIRLGFMNNTNIPEILEGCKDKGLDIVPFETTYFLSRETVVPTPGGGMMHWREKLFSTMSRNSSDIAEFFKLPDNSVVELGTRVQI